jgi:hypothetical protein
MKSNLGYWDRILRAILGGVIMAAGIYFQTWLGIVGGVIFLTSVLSFCPIYFATGINSLKSEQKSKP